MPDIVITYTVSILSMRTAFTRPPTAAAATVVIGPHGCRQVHLMFLLLEGCIITGFSRTLLARQTLVESASIRLAACLSRPAWSSPLCLSVCLSDCLTVCPLCRCPCSSFCLTSHYCNALGTAWLIYKCRCCCCRVSFG